MNALCIIKFIFVLKNKIYIIILNNELYWQKRRKEEKIQFIVDLFVMYYFLLLFIFVFLNI